MDLRNDLIFSEMISKKIWMYFFEPITDMRGNEYET